MKIGLYKEKIYGALMKRTGIRSQKKSYETWLAKGYCHTPVVSFIIQSHNKSAQVKHVVAKLRQYPQSEIIVIDDGSDLGHNRALTRFARRTNEFVLRANDLYEIVMYDKAIRFANGKYLALLQDDDDFPDLSWVDRALQYFSAYPELVVLGGNDGLDFVLKEDLQTGVGMPYAEKPEGAFRFVHQVNRAPMWLNKALYEAKLTHLDFSFAPFQYDDTDLCLRAWLNGLLVGWYDAGFTSLSAGGMRIWNSSFARTQSMRNAAKLYEMYRDKKATVDQLVEAARQKYGVK